MNQNIIAYYNDRAKEYDKVYLNPPDPADLLIATTIFQTLFFQKTVLEIACGTGYWTERIAKTASSVYATDINERVVEVAKEKQMNDKVTFDIADMYNLAPDKKYEAVFGGFIWSHILLQDLDRFIDKLKDFLKAGGIVVFMDSNYVEGTDHDIRKITETDEYGNTYQTRTLENGATHRVLKNYPAKDFLFQKLSRIATEITYVNLTYYWITSCRITEPANEY